MRPDDAQVSKAFDEAPEIIREALTDGMAITFMAKLPSRYGIHIDTAGYVTEFIRNMLLGLIPPQGFIGKLTSVGIDDSIARQITSDLNKEVFVPLRDKIRSGETSARARAIPQVSVPDLQKNPVEMLSPETKTSEVPPYNLIRPVPTENTASISPEPAAPVLRPSSSVPTPTMRTMQHDMELVQHGSMPAPYPVAAPQLHPAQATPARTFQTASVPVNVPSVRPQPVPEMVHIVPDTARQPAPQVPQVTVSREYTADPYRETI